MKNLLIVFLKEPKKGTVKTRLAKQTNDGFALRFYEACLKDVWDRVKVFKPVFYSNTGFLYKNLPTSVQVGKDLGAKMCHAFMQEFENEYDNIVLIGTDTPHFEHKLLHEAFQALKTKPCVIGPSCDGGYYLIGFNKNGFEKKVFSGVQWSTSKVLHETLQRIHEDKVYFLQELNDIDTLQDMNEYYERYHKSLSNLHTIACIKDYYENI